MKPGIIVMSELHGPIAARVLEIQQRFDPRMARELPPHITIAGSSGMGPIHPSASDDDVRIALEQVARATPRFNVRLEPPMRFMQTEIIVLPLDPHGPLRTLHERIATSGLQFERPRFSFSPHCTLSFFPTLTPTAERRLLRVRVRTPVMIESVQLYLTVGPQPARKLLDLTLEGKPAAGARR